MLPTRSRYGISRLMWHRAETNISVDRTPSGHSKSMPPLLSRWFMCYTCSQTLHSLLLVSQGSQSYARIITLIAYVFTVPKDEIASSKLTIASLFFRKVFGDSGAVRGLNFLIALASFGNMIAVIIGISRRIRECGRQGVLPWTTFWVSTKPFGTPLGPYLVIWGLTMLMILAIPAGDAFTFSTFSLLFLSYKLALRSCNANTQQSTI